MQTLTQMELFFLIKKVGPKKIIFKSQWKELERFIEFFFCFVFLLITHTYTHTLHNWITQFINFFFYYMLWDVLLNTGIWHNRMTYVECHVVVEEWDCYILVHSVLNSYTLILYIEKSSWKFMSYTAQRLKRINHSFHYCFCS